MSDTITERVWESENTLSIKKGGGGRNCRVQKKMPKKFLIATFGLTEALQVTQR